MIAVYVRIEGTRDPQPEFVAEVQQHGQSPEERDMLAHWVRSLDSDIGIRRLRAALRKECDRIGVPVPESWNRAR